MNLNGGGPQINPAPQPTVWGFDTTPDGKFVVLVKQTVGGTSVDFIDVDTATALWQGMREQTKVARRLASGLSIPEMRLFGPDGQPVPPSPEVLAMSEDECDAAAEQAAVDEVIPPGSNIEPPN